MQLLIKNIKIQRFRNIRHANLVLQAGFNVFIGDNGSGKSSLLEAMYFLAHGKSFRTHLLKRIIQISQQQFSLFASFESQAQVMSLGMVRQHNGAARQRLTGIHSVTQADIANVLPMLHFTPDSLSVLLQGSKGRRQLLDWGVFYYQEQFLSLWQKTQRYLKQRNAALKLQQHQTLDSWDRALGACAEQIDQYRQEYLIALEPVLHDLLGEFLQQHDIQLDYYRGWAKDKGLFEALQDHRQQDLIRGFTHTGPHRADFRFRVHGVPAQDVLSRGQQKLLICALKVAQGVLFYQQKGVGCIYLLDDIGAELDSKHRQLLINCLKKLNAQVCLTGISDHDLVQYLPKSSAIFHIENGIVSRSHS